MSGVSPAGRPESLHLLVVGAGVVGTAVALALQRDGHRVTLVERSGPAAGASFGNASVIATESVLPVSSPGLAWRVPGMLLDPLGPLRIRWGYLPRLSPWLLRFLAAGRPGAYEAAAAALASLQDGALEAWRRLLRDTGAEELLVHRGWLAVYSDPARLARAEAEVALQQRLGVPAERLDVPAIRQMEPALTAELAGGWYYPEVAHLLDPARVVERLIARYRERGGDLIRAEAGGFRHAEGGRVQALLTDAGELPCDGVVVAAGAWSRPLATALGVRLPLDTERGYHLTLATPGLALGRPVYSNEFAMAITPLGEGRLRLAGTVELGGLEAPPDWRRAEVLARRARRLFPDLQAEGAERWMGFRPSMPDSLPVLGPVPGLDNAWLAFGHGHLGVTLAARSAELIADLVAGRPPRVDAAPYRADRFGAFNSGAGPGARRGKAR